MHYLSWQKAVDHFADILNRDPQTQKIAFKHNKINTAFQRFRNDFSEQMHSQLGESARIAQPTNEQIQQLLAPLWNKSKTVDDITVDFPLNSVKVIWRPTQRQDRYIDLEFDTDAITISKKSPMKSTRAVATSAPAPTFQKLAEAARNSELESYIQPLAAAHLPDMVTQAKTISRLGLLTSDQFSDLCEHLRNAAGNNTQLIKKIDALAGAETKTRSPFGL